jgi:hypothetical protein
MGTGTLGAIAHRRMVLSPSRGGMGAASGSRQRGDRRAGQGGRGGPLEHDGAGKPGCR